jgi:hypothetical protein
MQKIIIVGNQCNRPRLLRVYLFHDAGVKKMYKDCVTLEILKVL